MRCWPPALASDDSFRLRFIQASRVAAAVDDPHIIPVFEAGGAVAGGSVYVSNSSAVWAFTA